MLAFSLSSVFVFSLRRPYNVEIERASRIHLKSYGPPERTPKMSPGARRIFFFFLHEKIQKKNEKSVFYRFNILSPVSPGRGVKRQMAQRDQSGLSILPISFFFFLGSRLPPVEREITRILDISFFGLKKKMVDK